MKIPPNDACSKTAASNWQKWIEATTLSCWIWKFGDMHGVDQAKPLLHAAFAHELFNRASDVDETTAVTNFKLKLLRERFHGLDMPSTPSSCNFRTRGYGRPFVVKICKN